MREISNLELKIQLTNEYLRTGGVEKIYDVGLLNDLLNVKFDSDGKTDPETISSRLNAFMLAILASHLNPPFHSNGHISEYGSFIQKSTLFNQIQITEEKQIDDAIEKFKDSADYLFRGQRESKWRLYNTLQRLWILDGLEESESTYLTFLKAMVDKGKNDFQPQIEEILKEINIDSVNDISVLGFLQHHGCPTPLLDWTYDFNTALFFGLDGIETYESPKEIDNYFSIYFVQEKFFNSGGMREAMNEGLISVSDSLKMELIAQIAEDENQRKEMEEHFKERSFFDNTKISGSGLIKHMTKVEHIINVPLSYFSDKDTESGIAFSLMNSDNIKKQNGVFIWNPHHGKPLEMVGNELFNEQKKEQEPNDYRFCECYNIHKDLAPYISAKLQELNITKQTVYSEQKENAKHIYSFLLSKK